jgi:hypothetical protein
VARRGIYARRACAPLQETGETSAENMSAVMQNPEFLNSVLGSLPGVDPEDEGKCIGLCFSS